MKYPLLHLSILVIVGMTTVGCASSSTHTPTPRPVHASASSTDDAPTTPRPKPPALAPFGRPAAHRDQAAISAAVRAYTAALANDDGASACAYLARPIQTQIQTLLPTTERNCRQALTSMFAQQTTKKHTALLHTTVSDIRLHGDRAYAFIQQPDTPAQFFPMTREENQWKVAALGPTALEDPPSH